MTNEHVVYDESCIPVCLMSRICYVINRFILWLGPADADK